MSPASGGGRPVVARPRALEFRRGQGRNGSMCGTNSFTRPRERAEAVGWLGDHAGSRARRWLPRNGRGRNHSGELAARAGQQASAGATGGPKGVGSSTSWRGKAGGGGVHRVASMADGGGSVLARGEDRSALYPSSRRLRHWLGHQVKASPGMGHSMAGVQRNGRRCTAANRQPGAARSAYDGDSVGWPARRV
jgi:hypothetical protein